MIFELVEFQLFYPNRYEKQTFFPSEFHIRQCVHMQRQTHKTLVSNYRLDCHCSWVTGDTIIYSVSMMASLALPTSYAMFIHGCNGRFTSSCFGFLNHGSERLRDPSGAFSRRIDHRINAMPFPTNLFANVPSILGRSWDDHGHDEAETFVNFTIDDGDLDPERNQVQQLQHPF